jgi:hypothetical protein
MLMRVFDFFIYYNPQLEVMVAETPKCVIRAATNHAVHTRLEGNRL